MLDNFSPIEIPDFEIDVSDFQFSDINLKISDFDLLDIDLSEIIDDKKSFI